jgi:hypothetical protein
MRRRSYRRPWHRGAQSDLATALTYAANRWTRAVWVSWSMALCAVGGDAADASTAPVAISLWLDDKKVT